MCSAVAERLTMARLSNIPAALNGLPSTLERLPYDKDGDRRRRAPWRKWYGTARWQRLRWSVLEAAHFTCARCGKIEMETRRLVADHVVPHQGDAAKFWDEGNLQCLCEDCHNGWKAAEEWAAGYR